MLQLSLYLSESKPNPCHMLSHDSSDKKSGKCRKVYGDNQIHGRNQTMLQDFLPFVITKTFFPNVLSKHSLI